MCSIFYIFGKKKLVLCCSARTGEQKGDCRDEGRGNCHGVRFARKRLLWGRILRGEKAIRKTG